MASKALRIKELEKYITENGFVTIPQICDRFGISKNTARSDISELEAKGTIKKRYGGVESRGEANVPDFLERRTINAQSKSRIGRAAFNLIEAGDVIFIDSGSSVLSILENAKNFPKDVAVITSSLSAIQILSGFPNVNTKVLPGTLIHRTNSILSVDTITYLSKFNITKSFIGTTGITKGGALATSTQTLGRLKSEAIAQSEVSYLISDTSKIGRTCVASFAKLSDFDAWIADAGSEEGRELALAHGIRYIEA